MEIEQLTANFDVSVQQQKVRIERVIYKRLHLLLIFINVSVQLQTLHIEPANLEGKRGKGRTYRLAPAAGEGGARHPRRWLATAGQAAVRACVNRVVGPSLGMEG